MLHVQFTSKGSIPWKTWEGGGLKAWTFEDTLSVGDRFQKGHLAISPVGSGNRILLDTP